MPTSKSSARSSKKGRAKAGPPETTDDFQEAADREEETGGKWRAGDPAKATRAFMRALEIYNTALQRHPTDFDLAYNKARLQLEITQQPLLAKNVGLPPIDLLAQTLESHRFALRLKAEYPDLLFNTSQVLISLSEQLCEIGNNAQAIVHLHEALELLSACLSRQEMLYEEQSMDQQAADDGGVAIDMDGEYEQDTSTLTEMTETTEESTVLVKAVTPSDLLDTVHASLAALTTLVPLVDQSGLQTLGGLSESLTEEKAPGYLALLPSGSEPTARQNLQLDRAIFIAEYCDAQCNLNILDIQTYLERLDRAFDIVGKNENARALSREAKARVEMVLTALEHSPDEPNVPATFAWSQLGASQSLYSKAIKLETEDAKDIKAEIYNLKGEAELVRFQLASMQDTSLDSGVKRSVQTLLGNVVTFFKGASGLAANDGDNELEISAKNRWFITSEIAAALFGDNSRAPNMDLNNSSVRSGVLEAISALVDERFLTVSLGEKLVQHITQA